MRGEWNFGSLMELNYMKDWENLTEFQHFFDTAYTNTHTLLDAFAMLSVILYCPIFVSIRTKTHLISALNSKPDRYIRYQAVFIGLSKIFNLAVVFNRIFEVIDVPTESKAEFSFSILTNFGATPFIIQATYLSCNKRNVQAMLSMICPGRCLCRNPRRNNRVAPVMLMDGETTVHAIPNN